MMLSSDNIDWPTVVWNLQIARRKWVRFSHMLGCEWADTRTDGGFYVVVVQLATACVRDRTQAVGESSIRYAKTIVKN